jgi:hypothetical protein
MIYTVYTHAFGHTRLLWQNTFKVFMEIAWVETEREVATASAKYIERGN